MYTLDLRIRYSETDHTNHLTVPALINILQDTATMHSEDIGYGLAYLQAAGQGWFLTNYAIEIIRMPQMGEKIKVNTYPYNFRTCIGLRAFEIEDENGNLIARANSNWALMNLVKGMPQRIEPVMQEAYAPFDKPDGIPEMIKLTPEEAAETLDTFTVTREYIDTNGHMNNGVYLDIMGRYLEESFKVRCINVIFKKSLYLGDEVIVKRAGKADGSVQISFFCKEDLSCVAEYKK